MVTASVPLVRLVRVAAESVVTARDSVEEDSTFYIPERFQIPQDSIDKYGELGQVVDSSKGYTIYADTSLWSKDTTQVDTMRKSKSALDDPVDYVAQDSICFDLENSRANLFGNGQVNYQNLQLTADEIDISLDSSLVHAFSREDSVGNALLKPTFRQGTDEYEPDRISYNFKSKKAFITNVYTKQGEGFMQTSESKRDSSGLLYAQSGKYTTCDAKEPHF